MKTFLREADFVVVGTGAGGATVGRALARAGHSVLFVEEGPDRRDTPGERRTRDTMLGRFRDFGAQLAGGPSRIPMIQGRVVGGSTAINSAIFWQLPEAVFADWTAADPDFARELPYAELADATALAMRDLSVRPVERRMLGNNNLLLERGAQALGLEGKVIHRAENGCEGSARCLEGCPNKRRQGMDVSYIPDALAHGAELSADTKALKVRMERGRAIGVDVRRTVGARERGFLRARRGVILAAGALHTPWLLLKSGLRAGEKFTAHPGFSVAGLFPEKVDTTFGATQGYEVTALRKERMKLEGLGIPAAISAARLPGAGATLKSYTDRRDHLASWACLVRPDTHGEVRLGMFGGVSARIAMVPADYARALSGVKHLVRLFFAAGATEVFPGVAGAPSVLRRPEDFDGVTSVGPTQLSLVATHLFGGATIGGTVDHRFRVRGTESLYVADASLIPTTLGVNPQGTIMALARVAADRIANVTELARAAA
ncbi:MAG TPA: GMC family oxidoreductase [bacterium]|nr:GMC family oxidoreductase [bacterium]